MVNIGRQVLGDSFLTLRDRFTEAYKRHDLPAMEHEAALMREVLADLDRLTACHAEFSLGRWLDAARSFGSDEASKRYYETNARTLISVWGDSYHLTDYANRT